MKVKRSQIEELILMISPDTDAHLFPKCDLLGVLKHEILHLQTINSKLAEHVPTYEPRPEPDEVPAHIRNRMFEIFGRHNVSFPIHRDGCPATDGFGCRCNE